MPWDLCAFSGVAGRSLHLCCMLPRLPSHIKLTFLVLFDAGMQVRQEDVEAFFQPLPQERELRLPGAPGPQCRL